MTSFIIALVLLAVSLLVVVIRKTYYSIPLIELQRRARQREPLASSLYRAVAYGGSLRALLWILLALSAAGGVVMLARVSPVWLSLIIFISLLWAAFSWLPASRVTPFGARLTMLVTPLICWLLNYLHPILGRSSAVVEKRYNAGPHTGIYERADLLAILDRQEKQADNRLTLEELEIAKRALHFTDRQVGDVMTPRKHIKSIDADDTVGPVLIDELHKNERDVVLVRDKPKGPIVGSLSVNHLGIHTSGKVKDVMDDQVYFVHEDDNLSEALHAFFVTNRSLFVVVNNAEEYIGIITVKTMLEQLLGHIPGDDFEQYADAGAVARKHRRPPTEPKTDASQPEVVE